MKKLDLARQPVQGDLVHVTKKSRGRFPTNVAVPGDVGIVIAGWTNQWGTTKYRILLGDYEEVMTSESCLELVTFEDEERVQWWRDLRINWMSKTFVPIIVGLVPSFKGGRLTKSRSGEAIYVTCMKGGKHWLNKKHMHPHDWREVVGGGESEDRWLSVRVPGWLAMKMGVLGPKEKK
jgi:hypothetical protein